MEMNFVCEPGINVDKKFGIDGLKKLMDKAVGVPASALGLIVCVDEEGNLMSRGDAAILRQGLMDVEPTKELTGAAAMKPRLTNAEAEAKSGGQPYGKPFVNEIPVRTFEVAKDECLCDECAKQERCRKRVKCQWKLRTY